MGSLREAVEAEVRRAFEALRLDPALGTVEKSRRPELSQFQCNGAMAAAKTARQPPRAIADAVAERLRSCGWIDTVSVDGPGFLNLSVCDAHLAEAANRVADDPRLCCEPVADAANVVIDFGGPNVAKAMHVGHLRSSIIGDCLARLLRFMGERVISDVHLGD